MSEELEKQIEKALLESGQILKDENLSTEDLEELKKKLKEANDKAKEDDDKNAGKQQSL